MLSADLHHAKSITNSFVVSVVTRATTYQCPPLFCQQIGFASTCETPKSADKDCDHDNDRAAEGRRNYREENASRDSKATISVPTIFIAANVEPGVVTRVDEEACPKSSQSDHNCDHGSNKPSRSHSWLAHHHRPTSRSVIVWAADYIFISRRCGSTSFVQNF